MEPGGDEEIERKVLKVACSIMRESASKSLIYKYVWNIAVMGVLLAILSSLIIAASVVLGYSVQTISALCIVHLP